MVPKILSVKVEQSKKVSVLVLKRTFFSIIQLWRLVFLEPVEVQRRHVPHLKDLISGNLDFEAQGRNSTFIFLHALLKKAILLHKRAKGDTNLQQSVHQAFNWRLLHTSFRPSHYSAFGLSKNYIVKNKYLTILFQRLCEKKMCLDKWHEF